MPETIDMKYSKFCIWNGPFYLLIFLFFWGIIAGNLPPFQSDVPMAELAGHYHDNTNMIRTGITVSLIFIMAYTIWGLGISKVMEHMVGPSNLLVDIQKWGAGLTSVVFLLSLLFWLTGAFRPETLPDWTLQMLYDQAWLIVDLGYSVTSVQMIAIGVAALNDPRKTPLIPKWLAWFGIWLAFMFITVSLMPFFRSGPFARAGLLNFWVEFGLFTFWVPALTFYLLKAIDRIRGEQNNS